nr:chaperone protein dnaj [Quercus suber]
MPAGGFYPMYPSPFHPSSTNSPILTKFQLATTYLQTFLYTLFIRAGDPKPAPGTPRFNHDRRRILIFVILAYLGYTIYEADYQLRQAGDFYTLLAVPHAATERDIQSRFRRLTLQFHPDKAAPGTDRARSEAVYVALQQAKDTLTDPAKRFAYDRWGPVVLRWQTCRTVRDYVYTGVQSTAVHYVGSATGLLVVGLLGYLRQGMFWRYFVMASLLVVEVQMLTRPAFPAWLGGIVNPVLVRTGWRQPYLPFQMIELLRKLAVTLFIALAQLGPILQGANTPAGESGDAVSPRQLDTLEALTKAVDAETNRLMALECLPFMSGGPGGTGQLKSTLKEWLVQNTIRNDPELRGAINRVLEQRRPGVLETTEDRQPSPPPHVS